MLPRIRPMRLRLVREPFDHPDYIFELKHDGFRAVAYLQNGECKLISRNLKPLPVPQDCSGEAVRAECDSRWRGGVLGREWCKPI